MSNKIQLAKPDDLEVLLRVGQNRTHSVSQTRSLRSPSPFLHRPPMLSHKNGNEVTGPCSHPAAVVPSAGFIFIIKRGCSPPCSPELKVNLPCSNQASKSVTLFLYGSHVQSEHPFLPEKQRPLMMQAQAPNPWRVTHPLPPCLSTTNNNQAHQGASRRILRRAHQTQRTHQPAGISNSCPQPQSQSKHHQAPTKSPTLCFDPRTLDPPFPPTRNPIGHSKRSAASPSRSVA